MFLQIRIYGIFPDTCLGDVSLELRQPAGGGGGFGRPASQSASHPAGHLASHPASHHCFVHACLPHRPCSQDLKMMSPIHGVCGKISFPLNKAHHAWGWGFGLFARVGIRTSGPVAQSPTQLPLHCVVVSPCPTNVGKHAWRYGWYIFGIEDNCVLGG